MNKNELLESIKQSIKNDNISINDIKKELENYICLLTRENADLVEQYIKDDPKYPDDMADIIRDLGIYQNNSSYEDIFRIMNKNNLNKFVWQTAISNSIQGKTQKAKEYITEFIFNLGVDFYDDLKNGKKELVQDMDNYVYEKGGKKRHECSWCSKVCKYLNEYLFNGDEYFIYDNNVKTRLNDYRKKNGLSQIKMGTINHGSDKKPNKEWYKNFCIALDELREIVNNTESPELTRNEIDHIMWGFQKYPVKLARKNK